MKYLSIEYKMNTATVGKITIGILLPSQRHNIGTKYYLTNVNLVCNLPLKLVLHFHHFKLPKSYLNCDFHFETLIQVLNVETNLDTLD